MKVLDQKRGDNHPYITWFLLKVAVSPEGWAARTVSVLWAMHVISSRRRLGRSHRLRAVVYNIYNHVFESKRDGNHPYNHYSVSR